MDIYDELRQVEQAVQGLGPQETAGAFGYGPRETERLGELAVSVQLERLGWYQADLAVWLAFREEEVTAGRIAADPEWPDGYEYKGRVYQV